MHGHKPVNQCLGTPVASSVGHFLILISGAPTWMLSMLTLATIAVGETQ